MPDTSVMPVTQPKRHAICSISQYPLLSVVSGYLPKIVLGICSDPPTDASRKTKRRTTLPIADNFENFIGKRVVFRASAMSVSIERTILMNVNGDGCIHRMVLRTRLLHRKWSDLRRLIASCLGLLFLRGGPVHEELRQEAVGHGSAHVNKDSREEQFWSAIRGRIIGVGNCPRGEIASKA